MKSTRLLNEVREPDVLLQQHLPASAVSMHYRSITGRLDFPRVPPRSAAAPADRRLAGDRGSVGVRARRATRPKYSAGDLADRKNWIEHHAPLVKRIARYMMARLPASVEFDDVLQAGMLGLLDAVSRYKATQGAQFETYAAQRIRGAIVDELRRDDWLPRSVRKSMRKIDAAISALEQYLGRPPTEREIASQLSLPLEDYQHQLYQARGHQLLYSEDFDDPEGESAPGAGPRDILDALIDEDLRRRLVGGVAGLPEREKTVMSLYHEKELNLREIGVVLGVTESRVCQLYSQAVARLRRKLRIPGETDFEGLPDFGAPGARTGLGPGHAPGKADDSVAKRVVHQFGVVPELELLQKAGAVDANRLGAEGHLRRHLGERLARADQA